ncbi:hypothetical protein [Dokdonella sp.]|uniref:hypothetical protein n=1 Tax=Dokdonella sp. TaxID=2291710 RepID=UPI0035287AA7
MGRALVDIGELEAGRQRLLEALDELPVDATDQRLRALSSLAHAENLAERSEQAVAYQRQALALAEQRSDALAIRTAKAGLGTILANAGKRDEARWMLAEALRGWDDEGKARRAGAAHGSAQQDGLTVLVGRRLQECPDPVRMSTRPSVRSMVINM